MDLRFLFLALTLFGLLPLSVEAITRVSTQKDCYEPGDINIRINFQSDNPTIHDWVAIVPANAVLNPFDSSQSVDWSRTCGNKFCTVVAPRTAGTVTLPTNFVQQGTWKVILVSLGQGVWVGVAESQTFEMQTTGTCGGGNPAPVPQPTSPPTRTDTISMPTKAPVDAGTSSVSTNKVNYSFGENIRVTFQSANPRSDDWVGIVTSSTSSDNLVSGEFWMYVCGGQDDCTSTVSVESVFVLRRNAHG